MLGHEVRDGGPDSIVGDPAGAADLTQDGIVHIGRSLFGCEFLEAGSGGAELIEPERLKTRDESPGLLPETKERPLVRCATTLVPAYSIWANAVLLRTSNQGTVTVVSGARPRRSSCPRIMVARSISGRLRMRWSRDSSCGDERAS